jgi:transcription elongation factor GreA
VVSQWAGWEAARRAYMERTYMNNTNYMTEATRIRLTEELAKAEVAVTKAGISMGEAAGTNCDWHDNSLYDNAVMDYKIKGERETRLRRSLENVAIINPREKTDDVGIGNTVVVRLTDSDQDETFTILGEYDSDMKLGKLSYKTPIGQAIMGKKLGQTAEFSLGDNEKQGVTIMEIRKGEF